MKITHIKIKRKDVLFVEMDVGNLSPKSQEAYLQYIKQHIIETIDEPKLKVIVMAKRG